LTHLKKKSKIVCYRKDFEQNKLNLSKAWKAINELRNRLEPNNNVSMLQIEGIIYNLLAADQHSIS